MPINEHTPDGWAVCRVVPEADGKWGLLSYFLGEELGRMFARDCMGDPDMKFHGLTKEDALETGRRIEFTMRRDAQWFKTARERREARRCLR